MNKTLSISLLSDSVKEFLNALYKVLNNKSTEEQLFIIENTKNFIINTLK